MQYVENDLIFTIIASVTGDKERHSLLMHYAKSRKVRRGHWDFPFTIPFRPGSSVGIATDYRLDGPGIESRWGEIFRRPDRPWGPLSLLYNRYRVFPGGKVRPGRAADCSPPSSAAVMEE